MYEKKAHFALDNALFAYLTIQVWQSNVKHQLRNFSWWYLWAQTLTVISFNALVPQTKIVQPLLNWHEGKSLIHTSENLLRQKIPRIFTWTDGLLKSHEKMCSWPSEFRATFNVLEKSRCSLLDPVCVCFVFLCVYLRVCVHGCVGLGGYYCFLLVVVQSCLSCGTSVGCVMGFVERCSVSGVKQAQSRALPDAMGTSGLVCLRLRTHAHMPT